MMAAKIKLAEGYIKSKNLLIKFVQDRKKINSLYQLTLVKYKNWLKKEKPLEGKQLGLNCQFS